MTRFPSPPRPDYGTYPECVPRCSYDGGQVPGGGYFIGALPSGTCNIDGYACAMTIYDFCTLNGMKCTCSAGAWSCVVLQAGGGGCLLDGGQIENADAGGPN